MAGLGELERDCLARYCALLSDRLGARLVAIRLFGSAARAELWPEHSPMHSDIDLLVVTGEELAATEQEELVNETYPLFLECGRQLSPAFFGAQRLAAPPDERTREFLAAIEDEAIELWPGDWLPSATG